MGAVMEMLTPVLEVIGGISMPVKIAWGVWLAWGLAQLAWLFWPAGDQRIYRTTATTKSRAASGPMQPVASRPTTAPRAKKVIATPAAVSPYGTSDFLAVLDQEQRQAATAEGPQPPPVPLPADEPASSPYIYPLDVSKL